ncbi:MAG: hypothetical protein DDT31_01814 [Syntrophomonadaceae bacterium]|nr:hypothetical protein [Bacillota bacterium]
MTYITLDKLELSDMKHKDKIIFLLCMLMIITSIGCIEDEVSVGFEKIHAELDKADIEIGIAWDAIARGDYEIAKERTYNARSYIDKAFRYYLEIEPELTESEKVDWRTIFEVYRRDYDLTISTADWFIAVGELEKMADERFLTEFELHVRRTEELSKTWERSASELGFILRTNPELLDITKEEIDSAREWASLLEEIADVDRALIKELKAELPDYIPLDGRIIPVKVDLPLISEEIIPSNLARFFGGFDANRDGDIDLGEAQDFFYWVENNIKYRWDCEEAHLRPGFMPGFPIGDGRPGGEYWQTPHETWTDRAGDCEDMAILQVAFFNYFGISAYLAGVNAEGREVDHGVAIVLMGGTPEEFADFLGDLVYYEFEGGYYMLVDNAYSSAFGYLCGGLKEGQFIIHEIDTLRDSFEMHRHIRVAM